MTVIIQFVIYSQQTYSFEVKYTTKWPFKQVSQIIRNLKRPELYTLMIICSQINPNHCFNLIFKLKHNVENNMYHTIVKTNVTDSVATCLKQIN